MGRKQFTLYNLEKTSSRLWCAQGILGGFVRIFTRELWARILAPGYFKIPEWFECQFDPVNKPSEKPLRSKSRFPVLLHFLPW